MTKPIPNIEKYMTMVPYTINSDQTLLDAITLMHKFSIRHLPVMDEGKIVGIISERDVNFMQTLKGVDLAKEKVDQAMSLDPVKVDASTLIDVVCREMAENKIGSVLVEDNHKLVGIFTWIDALNAMDELLHTRLKKH